MRKIVTYPFNQERQLNSVYQKAIKKVVDDVKALLIPRIPLMNMEANLDAWDDNLDDVIQVLIQLNMTRLATNNLVSIFRTIGEGVSNHQGRQWDRWKESNPKYNFRTSEPWMKPTISSFVQENVRLITRVTNEDLIGNIARITRDGIVNGISTTDITKEISKRIGINKRHSRVIARDQIGKVNGQINKKRQQDVGITKYIWLTANDERVRTLHDERKNKEFSWDKPPSDGHPGIPIQCRCTANPVIEV